MRRFSISSELKIIQISNTTLHNQVGISYWKKDLFLTKASLFLFYRFPVSKNRK